MMTCDPIYVLEEAVSREALLTLCHDLEAAGIWLYLKDDTTLIAGPPELVRRSPALLTRLRTHKDAIMRLLQDCLAVEIFEVEAEDPRFVRETCPECERSCLVIHPPRRLEVHCLPDSVTLCPGAERAQQACVETILTAFIADRCVEQRMSVLSWYGLRGALLAWCQRRGWLLPPRPYLIAWMSAHYPCHGTEEDRPAWSGLTLRAEEWLGE
jgi:hypothetical protein